MRERLVRAYPAEFDTRGIGGSGLVRLTGYASTFDMPYEMRDVFGPYTETVHRNAFDLTLATGPDVAYLSNHGGLTMARTKSGSMHLSADTHGLHVDALVNPARNDVSDLLTAIADGDINEMSFAFRVNAQQWSPEYDQRELLSLDLDRGDVSAVNFGANPYTSADLVSA
jgi:HK97 family phage prohead protease